MSGIPLESSLPTGAGTTVANGVREPVPLTSVDRRIVEVVRGNARTPNQEIAARAGVAASTCSTRLRDLERRGVITGYHAAVDLQALGASMQAMIAVRLHAGARGRLKEFTEQVKALPGVLSVFFLGGEEDFLLHVAAADAARLRDFVVDRLSARSDVAATRTSIIFEHTRGEADPVTR